MSTPESSIFKQRLQIARETRKLSQDALAKLALLPSTAISHFETGARKPSFDNLKKLADALDVSVDYLMGRAESFNDNSSHDVEIFRDYDNLSERDRELARDFMARLAKRGDEK